MSRGGKGRGPDDRGQVEQAAGSRAKMECYKRRIYTYRKFRGGSREARWCTKVWARWHQVSVTPTRNLGYFLPQGSSSECVFYRPALDALESPRGESCGPEARNYQREAQSTVTRDLPVGSRGREREWRAGRQQAARDSLLWHLDTISAARTLNSLRKHSWTALERWRRVLCA